jgi:hypothetical protein
MLAPPLAIPKKKTKPDMNYDFKQKYLHLNNTGFCNYGKNGQVHFRLYNHRKLVKHGKKL